MGTPSEVPEQPGVGMDEIVTRPASWLAARKAAAMNSILTTQQQQNEPLRRTERRRRRKNMCQSLILGQVLSILIALASMSAASLDDRGVNLPSFVNLINYSLITVAFLGQMVVSRRSLSLPWWRYAVYALVSTGFFWCF